MELFKIIKKPVITEKSQRLELSWVYTMEVNSLATKVDIANAFQKLYGVTVEGVNIIKTRAKFKNSRKGVTVKKKQTTKALIALSKNERIADLMKLKIKD
ncbi:MAG: hypothetical protein ACD_3C00085G0017 [uncultured bacterium (gcode 4)]|uniref:Large ribosomal subunit protein uL23 n=1 Tax=uncultured bacterium (gcode 4) TaxID=1234023 RepID=K2FZ58_9BACT|nr:MAG: hypothetical protein ACD_3C00085G0017 [uncultured bacterium (gcode 4)]